jgi:hypothetical protein
MHAGADGGEFTTPTFRLQDAATSLRLNYATSAVGSVRVEVQDASGKPLEGLAASDGAEIYGDELARRVVWNGVEKLPAERPLRLRLLLRDADVYSIEVE